jgi:hypothetical protein
MEGLWLTAKYQNQQAGISAHGQEGESSLQAIYRNIGALQIFIAQYIHEKMSFTIWCFNIPKSKKSTH